MTETMMNIITLYFCIFLLIGWEGFPIVNWSKWSNFYKANWSINLTASIQPTNRSSGTALKGYPMRPSGRLRIGIEKAFHMKAREMVIKMLQKGMNLEDI
jgi:hypothetical protein